MKKLLMLIFILIAIWDAFTTFVGVYWLVGYNEDVLVYSIGATLMIFGFMIGTIHLLNFKGFIGRLLKFFWFIAFIIDVTTSFIGTSIFLEADNWTIRILLILVALLTSASGIIVSYIQAGSGNKPNGSNFSIEI